MRIMEFLRAHLQSTTKTDHIIAHFINTPVKDGFINTYCWSEEDIKELLVSTVVGTDYHSLIIERQIVEGTYIDRVLADGTETVSYYTIDLIAYEDSPQRTYEFRHINERTTVPMSVSSADMIMLRMRIESLQFNIRNKMTLMINKNDQGSYSVTGVVKHPQEADRLMETLMAIERTLSPS